MTGTWLALLVAAAMAAGQEEPSVRGFLVVEPFETRVEFLLRLEQMGFESIPVADELEAASVREVLENLARDWPGNRFDAQMKPDSAEPFTLQRVEFVRPDPDLGIAVDDRARIPLSEARAGIVFARKTEGPPDEITLEWNLFGRDGRTATVEFGAPGDWSARILDPENNRITWRNAASGVEIPTLDRIPAPPGARPLSLPFSTIAVVIGVGFVIGIARAKRSAPPWMGFGLVVCIAGAVFLRKARPIPLPNPFASVDLPGADAAEEIVLALLRNIYTSFEYRAESQIYDTLEGSVTGDLLERIYLEIQASLQLENQGGARVRVYNVDLKRCEPRERSGAAGFVADCNWVTAGTVTHWGHTHERTNRYEAVLTVDPAGETWKLSDLKLVNEERIDQKSTRNR